MLTNTRSHIIKTVRDTGGYFMLFGFFCILVVPFVVGIFADTDSYIRNSKTVILKPYEYIDKKHIVYDGSGGKDMFIIKSHNVYYGISYYRKNKVDYGASFSFPKNNDGIFIVVNTSEITSHQGSYKDPIPVMNFSLDGQEYKWDKESHQYSVERYYVREKILKPIFFHIAHFMMFAGLIMFISTEFCDFYNKKLKHKK